LRDTLDERFDVTEVKMRQAVDEEEQA